MIIIDFTEQHMEEAAGLACAGYQEERRLVPELPPVSSVPDLKCFTRNGLGAAAFEKDKMIGFLGFYNPWEDTGLHSRGTFSPVHAHGTTTQNREKIYQYLYQAAAEKMAERGINWHAIGLYRHDKQAIKGFYTYGFGLRCVEAIRPMTKIDCAVCHGLWFYEINPDEKNKLLSLKNMLINHLGRSPSFIYCPKMDEQDLEVVHKERQSRYFVAAKGDEPVAFLEVSDEGESFFCGDKSMKNICGTYCLPNYRGRGVYQNLLNYVISQLAGEGYTRLGVDFESFNPTANGFWLKYFTPYTHSVVRRIDEKILTRM